MVIGICLLMWLNVFLYFLELKEFSEIQDKLRQIENQIWEQKNE